MCDMVVKILISTTFKVDHDIHFFFDKRLEQNFFGEQCYCGCTSPVNQYFTVPLPFLQESARIRQNPQDSSGFLRNGTGFRRNGTGIHRNGTGIEQELSEIRLARYIYTNMHFCTL